MKFKNSIKSEYRKYTLAASISWQSALRARHNAFNVNRLIQNLSMKMHVYLMTFTKQGWCNNAVCTSIVHRREEMERGEEGDNLYSELQAHSFKILWLANHS